MFTFILFVICFLREANVERPVPLLLSVRYTNKQSKLSGLVVYTVFLIFIRTA